jgi:hypothetical protein
MCAQVKWKRARVKCTFALIKSKIIRSKCFI